MSQAQTESGLGAVFFGFLYHGCSRGVKIVQGLAFDRTHSPIAGCVVDLLRRFPALHLRQLLDCINRAMRFDLDSVLASGQFGDCRHLLRVLQRARFDAPCGLNDWVSSFRIRSQLIGAEIVQ